MSRVIDMFTRLRDDEDGAALVEYTILIGIIAVAVIGAITFVGGWMEWEWNELKTEIGTTGYSPSE